MAGITADYNAGRYLPALEKALVIVRREPKNLEVHYLLGNIFIRLDKLENAYEEYNFCVVHGKGTKVGDYAQKAMKRMQDMAAQADEPRQGQPPQSQQQQQQQQPQPQALPQFPLPPSAIPQSSQPTAAPTAVVPQAQDNSRVGRQSTERSAAANQDGAAFIANKRKTLESQIQHLNSETTLSISQVPRYIYFGKQRIANPDYDSTVQAIRDECASKIKAMQDDNAREEEKINAFYRGLSDSYGRQKDNLRSQGDDGREGHKLLDQDPNMYVQNFGPGRSGTKQSVNKGQSRTNE